MIPATGTGWTRKIGRTGVAARTPKAKPDRRAVPGGASAPKCRADMARKAARAARGTRAQAAMAAATSAR